MMGIKTVLLLSVVAWLPTFNLEAQIGSEYASGEVKYLDNKAVSNAEIKFYVNGALYKTAITNTNGSYSIELSNSLIRQVETMGGIEVEVRVLINQFIYPFKKRLERKSRRKVEDLSLTIDKNIQFFRGEIKNGQNEHLPGIFVLVHGVHDSNTIRDSTYSDKEGIFYFKLPKGNYTIDLVFKDENRKYKDDYKYRFALPSLEPYFQTLTSLSEDSINTIRLKANALVLKDIVDQYRTSDDDLEFEEADSIMKEGNLYLKEQKFDKAQNSYDRARTIYTFLFTKKLEVGKSKDASFWKMEALTIKNILNKPKTKDEKTFIEETDALIKTGDELLLNSKFKEAASFFEKAYYRYNIFFAEHR
jgi:hypothetical protein